MGLGEVLLINAILDVVLAQIGRFQTPLPTDDPALAQALEDMKTKVTATHGLVMAQVPPRWGG